MKRTTKRLLSGVLALVICASTVPFAFATPLRGDVNLNGKTNSTDALLILKYSVGHEIEGYNDYTFDVNGDYKVNSTDALRVLTISVGKDDPLTYSKKELLKFYSDALLSAYTDTFRIDYSERYKSTLVNNADSSQKIEFDDDYAETFLFTDGYDEYDCTPVDYFPLPWIYEEGVADVTIEKTDSGYKMKIKLIEEAVTFDDPIPPYHADHAGYADCTNSGFEDAWVEDSSAVFSGAEIIATISAEGYVTMLHVNSPFVINMTLATEYDSSTIDVTETGAYSFTLYIYK